MSVKEVLTFDLLLPFNGNCNIWINTSTKFVDESVKERILQQSSSGLSYSSGLRALKFSASMFQEDIRILLSSISATHQRQFAFLVLGQAVSNFHS